MAVLIDTKKQTATSSFISTQIVTFSWHLWNRRGARADSHTHAKRTIIKKIVTCEIKKIYIEQNRKYL